MEFDEVVELICKEDPRFDRRAYTFVREGLDHTVKEIRKKEAAHGGKPRHVSGEELSDGLRAYALDQYGPLAKTVLNSWGLETTRHFGEIVFNLIEYHVFSKTDNDHVDDFADRFRFEDAFVTPFLPSKTPPAVSPYGRESLDDV